jgi:hypothetical protein
MSSQLGSRGRGSLTGHLATRTWQSVPVVVFCLILSLFLAACGEERCQPGWDRIDGYCTDRPTQNFVVCTRAGAATLTSDQRVRLEAGIETTLKIAGAKGAVEVVNAAAQSNFESASLVIINACVTKLIETSTSPQETTGLVAAQRNIEAQLTQLCTGPEGKTPSIEIRPTSGSLPASIEVTGSNWPPNEVLEITRGASTLDRVTTNGQGRFSRRVNLPAFPGGVGPQTITLYVQPVDSLVLMRCPQMRQSALFQR